METDQQHAGNEAAKLGNALQEINANPTPIINEISQLPKASETPNGDENIEPMGPEEDGIKYSENIIPAEEDENSDHENPKPTSANVGVGLQEKKKRKKKKSKSKRGLVTSRIALHRCDTDLNHDVEGKADRL